MATAFTIFKGFVCTGILYLPSDFIKGGWGFSAICIVAAGILTLYCAKLLLEVSEKTKSVSFPEIGFKCYGKVGRICVDISLASSQFGFVCAYIYFIASQIGGEGGIIPCITASSPGTPENPCPESAGGVIINKWWFMLLCMAIYVPLVLVRKIEVFAITHLFGDIMIMVTLIAVITYAGINVGQNGWQTQ